MSKTIQSLSIEEIIKKAVREGIEAGMNLAKKNHDQNPYKQTEKLLYSYNGIREFIDNCREELMELQEQGLRERAKSFVYIPSGSRISCGDVLEAKIQDLRYKVQVNEREVEKIDKALEIIKDDEYYNIIKLKYLRVERMNDEEIANELHCDRSTVCRNRNRLVLKIAVNFFGKDALS